MPCPRECDSRCSSRLLANPAPRQFRASRGCRLFGGSDEIGWRTSFPAKARAGASSILANADRRYGRNPLCRTRRSPSLPLHNGRPTLQHSRPVCRNRIRRQARGLPPPHQCDSRRSLIRGAPGFRIGRHAAARAGLSDPDDAEAALLAGAHPPRSVQPRSPVVDRRSRAGAEPPVGEPPRLPCHCDQSYFRLVIACASLRAGHTMRPDDPGMWVRPHQGWRARSLPILTRRVQGGGDVFDEDHQVARVGW